MYVNRASIKKKVVTIILALINVGMYLVVNVYLNSVSGIYWLHNLAQHNDSIFRFGDYYRLFTAMLVHADELHLLSNMFALIIFGMLVENKYSITQYLTIYFVSGFLGNIVSLWILPLNAFSLGASGCIFGVMGAYYVSFTAYNKKMIFYAIISSAIMVGLSIGADINSWAHLLGAVGGLVLGFIFTQYNKKKLQKNHQKQVKDPNYNDPDDDDKYHYNPRFHSNNDADDEEEIEDY
ncbi:MAG: rhomboid family intramembrane serine protease [Promethearchaeota archaeon]